MSERQYYHQRENIPPPPLDFEGLKRGFFGVYLKFTRMNYFKAAFGYDCVDDGYNPGDLKLSLPEHLFQTFKRTDLYPIESSFENYDLPTLFTIIEYLFDFIAKPTKFRYHSWDNCGVHVFEGDYNQGKSEFRSEIKDFLTIFEDGYQLDARGFIMQLNDEAVEDLLSTVPETEDPNIDDKINQAIKQFLHYSASLIEKKQAIRELADILELIRDEVSENLTRDDENRLFEIANQFGIRHHSVVQKIGWEKKEFLDWIFMTYLNTVKLLLRLRDTTTNSR